MKPTNDNISKSLSIRLDTETFNMLKSISIWLGTSTPTETIRTCIKDIYEGTTIQQKEFFYKKGFVSELKTFNTTFEEHLKMLDEMKEIITNRTVDLDHYPYTQNQGDLMVAIFEKMLPMIEFLVNKNKSDFITETSRISSYISSLVLRENVDDVDIVIKNIVKHICLKLVKDNLAPNESEALLNIHSIALLVDSDINRIDFTVLQGEIDSLYATNDYNSRNEFYDISNELDI